MARINKTFPLNTYYMPDPKTESCLSFEALSGGLNLWELDYRLATDESPEMKNLIWRDGALNSRNGQYWIDQRTLGTGYTSYERLFHGYLVAHVGTHLYAFDVLNPQVASDTETKYCDRIDLCSDVPEIRGTFFIYNGDLYYKTTGSYKIIEWDGTTMSCSDVGGYTPIIVINATPENGSGDTYQPENRLSAQKTVWYNAKETSKQKEFEKIASAQTVFQLDYTSATYLTGVTYVWVTGDAGMSLQDSDTYTVSLSAGTVTLNSAAAAGSTVTIQYTIGSTEYYLPVQDLDSVDTVIVDGVTKVEGTDYSVDLTNGVVKFTTPPPTTFPATNNTVKITYSKANPTYYNSVMSCNLAATYGGTGDLCIVLGGCEAQSNAYLWNANDQYSMRADYFSADNYQLCGSSDDPITNFGKQQSYLIIFSEDSIGRTSADTTTVNDRTVIDLPYTPINDKIGCDLPWSVQLVENYLVWANRSEGVLMLQNTSPAYENNILEISSKINTSRQAGNSESIQALLEDLKTADAGQVCSVDDDRHYWLNVGDKVWVWDYVVSTYKDPSWFYWTDISAMSYTHELADVYHLNANGQVTAFGEVYGDYDEGIEKVYRFATQNLYTYDYLKNINSVIITSRSDTNSEMALTYMTDYETRVDKTPIVSAAWMLVPRNLSMRSLKGRKFAEVFRRRPMCRRVKQFTMKLTNSEVGEDLSLVSAYIYYNYQGKLR